MVSRSAGVFCVAKVSDVPFVLIVPIGWLNAAPRNRVHDLRWRQGEILELARVQEHLKTAERVRR